MEDTRRDVPSATVDGNIQCAISLLSSSLNGVTKNNVKDFDLSLKDVLENWSTYFPCPASDQHKKYFKRALNICKVVPHQTFDFNEYEHVMESLAAIARFIQCPDTEKEILKLLQADTDSQSTTQGQSAQEMSSQARDDLPATKLAEMVQELEMVKKKKGNKKKKANATETLQPMDQKTRADAEKEAWLAIKEEGNRLYALQRWTDAMNHYTWAIHLNRAEPALYSNRALCEIQLAKYELAREDAEDAIQLDPKCVKYYRTLSQALLALKLHTECLAACREGLLLDPRDVVLLERKRDCGALIATEETDKNPRIDGSQYSDYDEMVRNTIKKMGDFAKQREECSKLARPEDIQILTREQAVRAMKLCLINKEAHEHQMGSSAVPKNSRKAFKLFESAGKRGSAEGLYNAALFFERRGDQARDFKKSLELMYKAAQQKAFQELFGEIVPNLGVAEAENSIGNAHRDGRGVDKNEAEAFKWYLKSAQHGCLAGQNNLGIALFNGHGFKQNEKEARCWFKRAAESGLAEAQFNYAQQLIKGEKNHNDLRLAEKYLKLAADQGSADCMMLLQQLARSGALGASAMENVKEDLVEKTKKKDPESLYLLGTNYATGEGGFPKDLEMAEKCLKEATAMDHPGATVALSQLLEDLRKYEEAFIYTERAASQGSSVGCQVKLGEMLAYGHGCAQDIPKARRWLQRAKQQGFWPPTEMQNVDKWIEGFLKIAQDVVSYETRNRLAYKTVSMRERTIRFLCSKSSCGVQRKDVLDNLIYKLSNLPPVTPQCDEEVASILADAKLLPSMKKRAQNGSVKAIAFFKAHAMFAEAENCLAEGRTRAAFAKFREARRMWDFPIICAPQPFHAAAKRCLEQNPDDAEAMFILCCLGLESFRNGLLMAKRCVQLNPSVAEFHHLLGCMWGFAEDFNNGFKETQRAYELLPHPGWLYDIAGHLRLQSECQRSNHQVIEAYQRFLAANPPDHRKVPEALYCIAHAHLLLHDIDNMEKYFRMAQVADGANKRLPCFPPVTECFPPKLILSSVMELLAAIEKPVTSFKMHHQPTKKPGNEAEPNCLNCVQAKVTFRCARCKNVWYCGRDCQRAHWTMHKRACQSSPV